jgi:hypothetical protein
VQQEIHGAEAGDAVHQFDAEESAALELFRLSTIQCVMFGQPDAMS